MNEPGDFQKPTVILRGMVIGADRTDDYVEITVKTDQGEDQRVLFHRVDDEGLADRAASLRTDDEVTVSYRRDGDITSGFGLAVRR